MQDYNVRFIGDYFSTVVSITVDENDTTTDYSNEETIIDLANNILKNYYGWDAKAVSTIDIEVEEG